MLRDDWVTVVPPEGQSARVAAELLALAQHPGHVRTQGGAAEFLVPPYLAELYIDVPEAPRPRRRTKKEGDE